MAVVDLDAARRAYERLGFVATPRGRHRGWGTANYCVMFERDYIELLGVVDPALFTNGLNERLAADGEGGLGVALRSDDAAATRIFWRAQGLAPTAVEALGRTLELEEGEAALEFDTLRLEPADIAGLSLFACVHKTPEPMRRPAWTTHPNGVVGLASITWRVADASAVKRAFEQILGRSRVTDTDGVIAGHLGDGAVMIAAEAETLSLMDASVLDWGFDHPEVDQRPEIVRIGYRCRDLAAAALILRVGGVPFSVEGAGELVVPPEHGLGVHTVFERDIAGR